MSNVINDNPLQSREQPARDVGSPASSNIALSITGEDVTFGPMVQSTESWVTALDSESVTPSPSSGPVIVDPQSESITPAVVSPPHSALYFPH